MSGRVANNMVQDTQNRYRHDNRHVAIGVTVLAVPGKCHSSSTHGMPCQRVVLSYAEARDTTRVQHSCV
jgi:hypothetical protein